MIFGPFSRKMRRAAGNDEKQLIPTPVPYSDVYSYGRDHATEPRSRASLANNAFIITPTPTSPTSLGTSRPRSSTQANAGTLQSSSRPEDESGSSAYVWAQPSLSSKNESQTTGNVPNITGQVAITTSRPMFEGTYSSVYRGTYGTHEV
jgi:hypothetical protein